MKPDLVDFHTVDLHDAVEVREAEQRRDQGRLSRACSSHDTDLLLRIDHDVQIFQHRGLGRSVSHHYVLKLNLTLRGPTFLGLFIWLALERWFALHFAKSKEFVRPFATKNPMCQRVVPRTSLPVLQYTFHRGHLILHLGTLSHAPLEHAG